MKRGGPRSSSSLLPRLQSRAEAPLGSASGDCASGGCSSEQAAAHAVAAPRLEDVLRGFLAALCQWLLLLLTFAGLQDAVLAISSLRRVVSFALTPRCRTAVLGRLLPLGRNTATWDNITYHVSPDTRKLLLHGSLHGLVHGAEVRTLLAVLLSQAKLSWRLLTIFSRTQIALYILIASSFGSSSEAQAPN